MKFRGVGTVIFIALFGILPTTTHASTPTDTCPSQYNATQVPVIFDPAQDSAEYSADGYLIYHLRLLNPSADGDSFNLRLKYSTDHCGEMLRHFDFGQITLGADVTDISIRSTSLLTYDVWDDTHNVLLKQIGPVDTVVPPYSAATPLAARAPQNGIEYSGHTYPIKEGSAPPVFENKVTKPTICPEHDMSGFLPIDLGDARAEYVNHLLRVHLRFTDTYYPSAGFERNPSFGASVVPAGDDCSFANTDVFSLPSVGTPHNVWYFSIRFTSPTHWELWDDENDVPFMDERSSPYFADCRFGCSGDLPPGTTYAYWFARQFGPSGGASTLRTSPYFVVEPATAPQTPVIIVPGILGSMPHNGEWVIDPITHSYDNLIDTLAANGYQKDVTLFTFPYDWHLSNAVTATILKNKIAEVKNICGCDKVDLVAHSMGGLIARSYIQSDQYNHDVRKLIFLGTPQLGAPKAYLMWEGGEAGTGFEDKLLREVLKIEGRKKGYTSLFEYEHNFPIPSVQELLPVYGYIKHVGSADIPAFPNSQWYPGNLFLGELNNNITALYGSGVSMTAFVGQLADNQTITTIRVVPPVTASSTILWGFGQPENFGDSSTDQGLERGAGDGTVALPSASFIDDDLQVFDSVHEDLPTKTEGQVFKKLTNQDATDLVNNSHGIFEIAKNVLIFQILSPADIQVIAPDGKKVGKDFSTGEEINQIPDAFYSGFGTDEEFVTIPNPVTGQYKVITQGTGIGGSYTVATGVVTEATSSDTFFTGITLPNLMTEHDINVNLINPSATTIVPADQMPPTITFIQPATTRYTHDATLPVNVIFSDTTGVATSSVHFDTTIIATSSTVDLFFQTLGNHTINASATDLVNNATSSSKIVQVIATASSTISDINRAFTLGWVKSKDAKNVLITGVTQASKLKKPGDRIVAYKVMLASLILAKNIGVVTAQGYQVLAADISWLINH